MYSLFWGDKSLEDPETDELEELQNVSEETERKYLTLSWWILHVGWKDVGERSSVITRPDLFALQLPWRPLDAHEAHCTIPPERRAVASLAAQPQSRKDSRNPPPA